jgi:hypothetical protein
MTIKIVVMKKFISANWYKIMMGTSLLITSVAFLIYSVSSAVAKDSGNNNSKIISPAGNTTILVRLPEDQLDKIIPKNEDGSINIRLSEEQMKALAAPTLQNVNIERIGGGLAGYVEHGNVNLLGTCTSKDIIN